MATSDPDAQASAEVDAEDEAERLVREEEAQADEVARRTREEAKGLLRFIDEDLTKEDFVMPVFDDQLKALQYVTGAVETRRQAQDIRHRRKLIRQVRTFTADWIVAVLVIVALSGIKGVGFDLANGVLIALVTTTTANVLGLAYIVLRGMFDREPPDHTPGSATERPAADDQ